MDCHFSPPSFDKNRFAFFVPAIRIEGSAGLTAIASALPPNGPVGIHRPLAARAHDGAIVQIAAAMSVRCKENRIREDGERIAKPLCVVKFSKTRLQPDINQNDLVQFR